MVNLNQATGGKSSQEECAEFFDPDAMLHGV